MRKVEEDSALRMKRRERSVAALDSAEGELCKPDIVDQTCAQLNSMAALEELLSVPPGAGQHFYGVILGVEGEYDCAKMCAAVTKKLAEQNTLPPKNDVGCIVVDG